MTDTFSPAEEEPPELAHISTVPPPPWATFSKEVRASLAGMMRPPFKAEDFRESFAAPDASSPFLCTTESFAKLMSFYVHEPPDRAASVADYLNDMHASGATAFAGWADATNLYVLFRNE